MITEARCLKCGSILDLSSIREKALSEMNLKVKELKKSFDKDRYSKEIVLMIIDKVFGDDLK